MRWRDLSSSLELLRGLLLYGHLLLLDVLLRLALINKLRLLDVLLRLALHRGRRLGSLLLLLDKVLSGVSSLLGSDSLRFCSLLGSDSLRLGRGLFLAFPLFLFESQLLLFPLKFKSLALQFSRSVFKIDLLLAHRLCFRLGHVSLLHSLYVGLTVSRGHLRHRLTWGDRLLLRRLSHGRLSTRVRHGRRWLLLIHDLLLLLWEEYG